MSAFRANQKERLEDLGREERQGRDRLAPDALCEALYASARAVAEPEALRPWFDSHRGHLGPSTLEALHAELARSRGLDFADRALGLDHVPSARALAAVIVADARPTGATSGAAVEAEAERMAARALSADEPRRVRRQPGVGRRLSGGRALPSDLREDMESRFGASFEDVRVHTDAAADRRARAAGARAFALGPDLVFRREAWAPTSGAGRRLVAHELAHVVQQRAIGQVFMGREEDPDAGGPSVPGAFIGEAAGVFRQTLHGVIADKAAMDDALWQAVSTNAEALSAAPAPRKSLDWTDQQHPVETYDTVTSGLLDAAVRAFSGLTFTLEGQSWDLAEILQLLGTLLGRASQAPEGLEMRLSFGADYFCAALAVDCGWYLAYAIEEGKAPPADMLESTRARVQDAISRWEDGYGLLELELEGALYDLERKHMQMQHNPTPETGARIGEISRFILLLGQQLEPLRQIMADEVPPESAGGVGTVFRHNGDSVNASTLLTELDAAAGDESSTFTHMNVGPEALADRTVMPERWLNYLEGAGNVSPDEAFPESTDAASAQMLKVVASDQKSQSTELDQMFARLVPGDSASASYQDYVDVYQRWFTFFSKTARDNDPMYKALTSMYTDLVHGVQAPPKPRSKKPGKRKGGMLSLGTEGGIATGALMFVMAEQLGQHMPGATPEMVMPELTRMAPRRDERIAGSADGVDYSSAEIFPGTTGPESGAYANREAETSSRDELLGDLVGERTRQFEEVAKQKQPYEKIDKARELGLIDEHGRIHLQTRKKRGKGWRYFGEVRVQGKIGDEEKELHYEEKFMRKEVGEYLLALSQHHAARRTHSPGIGDASTRERGVEEGGMEHNKERMLGQLTGSERDTNAARRQQIEQVQKVGASTLGGDVEVLVDKLEEWLDGWFAANTDTVSRVMGIIPISIAEYDTDESAAKNLDWKKISWAVAKGLAESMVLTMLQRLPGIMGIFGQAIVEGYNMYKKTQGGVKGSEMAHIAGWILFVDQHGDMSFRQARVAALFFKDVANSFTKLLASQIAGAATASIKSVVPRGKDITPESLAKQMKETMPDKKAREAFVERMTLQTKESLKTYDKQAGKLTQEQVFAVRFMKELDYAAYNKIAVTYKLNDAQLMKMDGTLKLRPEDEVTMRDKWQKWLDRQSDIPPEVKERIAAEMKVKGLPSQHMRPTIEKLAKEGMPWLYGDTTAPEPLPK